MVYGKNNTKKTQQRETTPPALIASIFSFLCFIIGCLSGVSNVVLLELFKS